MTINTKNMKLEVNSKHSKDDIFNEMNYHLLNDDEPSRFFNSIVDLPVFKEFPFQMLYKLKDAEQSPKYHPEGSVWNHTMLVVDHAAKRKGRSIDAKVFMWAALLHDIGKPDTTKKRKGKITSYDHEKLGAKLTKDFLSEFITDDKFIEDVSVLVRWHMQILHVVKNLPFADIEAMKQQANIFEVALLGLCDRLGRLNVNVKEEETNIANFIKKCNGE
nr:HDIG domain-containing metalloprotein [Sedimentibacter sp.]